MGNTFRLRMEGVQAVEGCSVMDERLRFVAKLRDGESMTQLCREFGISRKIGCKIFQRYRDSGVEAVSESRDSMRTPSSTNRTGALPRPESRGPGPGTPGPRREW
jgi:hypothetical protein